MNSFLSDLSSSDLKGLCKEAAQFGNTLLGRAMKAEYEGLKSELLGAIHTPPVDITHVLKREQLIGESRQLDGLIEFFDRMSSRVETEIQIRINEQEGNENE